MTARTDTQPSHAWLHTWADLATERATDPDTDPEFWLSIAKRLNHASHLLSLNEKVRAASVIDSVLTDLIGKAPTVVVVASVEEGSP
jgi:hypothetical protein